MYLNLQISVFCFLVTKTSTDVITLTKNQTITCVLSDESVYSALWISSSNPKYPHIDTKINLTELTQWVTSDWNSSTTQYQSFYPITDIRWEAFTNLEDSQININLNSTTAFSVCFRKRLIFSASDGSLRNEFQTISNEHENVNQNVCQWLNYMVKDNLILEIKNSGGDVKPVEVWKMGFIPRYLVFQKTGTLIKAHQYDFHYSLLTTLSNVVSYLDVSNLTNSTNLCISMFVSVDEHCYLDVVLESPPPVRVKGFNTEHAPKTWRRIQIITGTYKGTGKLHFYRSRSDNTREGFWAIDKIHVCKPFIDVYNLTTTEKNSSYLCKTLMTTTSTDGTFCENPGFLGRKCTAKCAAILGKSYPFCEGYKICSENETCACSWGFKGIACDEGCIDDHWGLACASKINFTRCEQYSNTTGCTKCTTRFSGRQCSEMLPMVLKPPTLVSVKESFVEISLKDMKYGEKEKEPDFYQIQYNESNDTNFKNWTTLVPYKDLLLNGTVTIRTSFLCYKIRVLLFVGSEHFEDGVPELIATPKVNKRWYIDILLLSSIVEKYWLYILFTIIAIWLLYIVVLFILLYYCGKDKGASNPKAEVLTLLYLDNDDFENIPIEELENYVRTCLEKNQFCEEFKLLSNEKFQSCGVAVSNDNINKNKNKHYIPYDSTRVILRDMEGVGSNDYINASYIDGFSHCKAYIVCQGPKYFTVVDFWRMIWLEEVETIVMASDFVESDGSRSCAEYWSPRLNTHCEYGALTIKTISEEIHPNYYEKTFEVTYMKNQRQIRHLHLSCSSILYSNDLLPILQQLHHISAKSLSPIVIHSGLENDRSGTLILCDLALHMAKAEQSVNFHVLLGNMRQQRPHMVTNLDYYILAHLTVLEFILDQQNPFGKKITDNLDVKVVEEQCRYLEKVFWLDSVVQGLNPQTKTRNPLRLTFVDGYQKPNQFLICQQPSKRLLWEFWETIKTKSITHVLFLNLNKDKLWPCKFSESDVVLTVTLQTYVEVTPSYTIAKLLLSTRNTQTKKVNSEQEILLFELIDWKLKEQIPECIDSGLTTIHYVKKVIEENNTPILVMCPIGVNASSLFTVVFNVLDKHEKEHEIDIYRYLRTAKRHDPNFTIRTVQLKFLYDMILEYITTVIK